MSQKTTILATKKKKRSKNDKLHMPNVLSKKDAIFFLQWAYHISKNDATFALLYTTSRTAQRINKKQYVLDNRP